MTSLVKFESQELITPKLKDCKEIILSSNKDMLDVKSEILNMLPASLVIMGCWLAPFILSLILVGFMPTPIQELIKPHEILYVSISLLLSLCLGAVSGLIQFRRINHRFKKLESVLPELAELREDILKGESTLSEYLASRESFCLKHYGAYNEEIKAHMDTLCRLPPRSTKYLLAQSTKPESSEYKKITNLVKNKVNKY